MRRIGVCMEGALQAATSSESGTFRCWEVAMKLKSQGQWHECPSPTGQDKLHKLFLCPFSPISSVLSRCFRPGYLCLNTLCLCHCQEMPKCLSAGQVFLCITKAIHSVCQGGSFCKLSLTCGWEEENQLTKLE